MTTADLTSQLNDFDVHTRETALKEWQTAYPSAALPPAGDEVNVHLHTFYSFNGENWSPTQLAVRARERGLGVAGIVDFDVLDAVEEFWGVAGRLGLRACAGIETRVFVPEFADRVINSPGEPGIAYHMGIAMPRRQLAASEETFLAKLKATAAARNRELLERVNTYLAPVTLDYEQDVLPLTPNGNATERHICKAYAQKAAATFAEPDQLADYWANKLETDIAPSDLPGTPALLDRIRAKTMKRGGVGYVKPDAASFPLMADMNAFVLGAGGIPCLAWLDGCSDGEQAMEELLDVAMSTGVMALNIIPDRNFTPGLEDEKVANLRNVIALAQDRQILIPVGTEMNAPGQKFVDDFDSAELAPYRPLFLQHAHILYAHMWLERYLQRGFLSEWAQQTYPDIKQRMAYFAEQGARTEPQPSEQAWQDKLAQMTL